jgi:uncharacterized protein (DUF1684 family)
MSYEVLDWRRRVFELYRHVREETEPERAHALWRSARDELLKSHPASPLSAVDRPSFRAARYLAYDASLRFEVEIEPQDQSVRFEVETGTDGVVAFSRIGTVHLEKLGTLDIWWHEGYGGGVFVPFRDTHEQTYGGGRYLIDTTKGADLGGRLDPRSGTGTLVLDFNFAYNPSCAYDPRWACPLAPAGNRLDLPIAAGELSHWTRDD